MTILRAESGSENIQESDTQVGNEIISSNKSRINEINEREFSRKLNIFNKLNIYDNLIQLINQGKTELFYQHDNIDHINDKKEKLIKQAMQELSFHPGEFICDAQKRIENQKDLWDNSTGLKKLLKAIEDVNNIQ